MDRNHPDRAGTYRRSAEVVCARRNPRRTALYDSNVAGAGGLFGARTIRFPVPDLFDPLFVPGPVRRDDECGEESMMGVSSQTGLTQRIGQIEPRELQLNTEHFFTASACGHLLRAQRRPSRPRPWPGGRE